MASNTYNADSIQVLHGLDAVRKRPGMYIGPTNSTGLHHLIWEIVGNAIDEAMCGFGKTITVTIFKDGSCGVLDEGRGIPVGINKEEGRPAVELVFSELHAGGKFSDSAYKNAGGLHGVGAAVTNALSVYLDVTVFSDGETYHLRYENGGNLVTKLEKIGPTKKRGTFVRFKPDPEIFSTVEFKADVIQDHLQESAFLIGGVKFVFNDERTGTSTTYCYEKGLQEYIANMNSEKSTLTPIIHFHEFDEDSRVETEISLQYCNGDYDETIFSYANLIRTRDGGSHETGFRNGLTRAINDFAENNNLLKGKKLEGADIREGITAIISIKIPEDILLFESQTKGKLTTPVVTTVVQNVLYNKLTYYLTENKEIALDLIHKCVASQQARMAARKAKEEARSTKKAKQEVILSDKLTPAQSKQYKLNELFIVEGDSAGGTAKKGRDRIHQAILPLRGKPLNTDSVSMDRLLQNEEFATLINTIGAGFGQTFDIEDIHYGKIIIMTDADTDGAHIQTLLLTFFYKYMKQLITAGHIYIAVPPLYRVFKEEGKKKIQQYAWTDEQLEAAKKKVGSGYKVNRYKGLGEMDAIQLKETTMDPATRLLVQVDIEDPFLVEKRINVLMGRDASLRRKWVEDNVDFNTVDTFLKEVK